jgi:hypothetical protein
VYGKCSLPVPHRREARSHLCSECPRFGKNDVALPDLKSIEVARVERSDIDGVYWSSPEDSLDGEADAVSSNRGTCGRRGGGDHLTAALGDSAAKENDFGSLEDLTGVEMLDVSFKRVEVRSTRGQRAKRNVSQTGAGSFVVGC